MGSIRDGRRRCGHQAGRQANMHIRGDHQPVLLKSPAGKSCIAPSAASSGSIHYHQQLIRQAMRHAKVGECLPAPRRTERETLQAQGKQCIFGAPPLGRKASPTLWFWLEGCCVGLVSGGCRRYTPLGRRTPCEERRGNFGGSSGDRTKPCNGSDTHIPLPATAEMAPISWEVVLAISKDEPVQIQRPKSA